MKKYEAVMKQLQLKMELDSNEVCTFITHFGRFDDIEVFDKYKNELLLYTKGTIIDKFYPDEIDRDKAYQKSRHLTYLFDDYNRQQRLKYPSGRFRSIYKELEEAVGRRDQLEHKVVVCNQCKMKVYPSYSQEYAYQCFECDEDLYTIETQVMEEKDYYTMMASKFGCSIEQMKALHKSYDAYVLKYIHQDRSSDSVFTLKDFYKSSELSKDICMNMALNLM